MLNPMIASFFFISRASFKTGDICTQSEDHEPQSTSHFIILLSPSHQTPPAFSVFQISGREIEQRRKNQQQRSKQQAEMMRNMEKRVIRRVGQGRSGERSSFQLPEGAVLSHRSMLQATNVTSAWCFKFSSRYIKKVRHPLCQDVIILICNCYKHLLMSYFTLFFLG